MTPERRAQINRRLAEFEWPEECVFEEVYLQPPLKRIDGSILPDAHRCQHGFGFKHRDEIDYTRDLNALARLEGRLGWHQWEVSLPASATDTFNAEVEFFEPSGVSWNGTGDTEAEARAEAIYLYLTSGDGHDR